MLIVYCILPLWGQTLFLCTFCVPYIVLHVSYSFFLSAPSSIHPQSYPYSTKRPRYTSSSIGEHSTVSLETSVITSGTPRYSSLPPPPYPHPPLPPATSHIYPPYGTHVPIEQTRRALVADDWNHIDVVSIVLIIKGSLNLGDCTFDCLQIHRFTCYYHSDI